MVVSTNENDPRRGFSSPNADEVTPSDTQSTMPWGTGKYAEYLMVTGTGTLVLLMAGGQSLTVTMPDNSFFWGRVSNVLAASTATGIVGFWN